MRKLLKLSALATVAIGAVPTVSMAEDIPICYGSIVCTNWGDTCVTTDSKECRVYPCMGPADQ